MAVLSTHNYQPNFIFKSKHFNTIYRTISSKFKVNYKRYRIDTPDNDFIDLDLASVKSESVAIVFHGLEGSSQSSYILSIVNYLNSKNIDAIAVNLRGCSGEDNNQLYAYHSGFTQDVDLIIKKVIKKFNYKQISLVGYSLGGNLILKYMADYADSIPKSLNCCIGVSAPCNLEGSSIQLSKKANYIYMQSFLKSLKKKTLLKFKYFPNHHLNTSKILKAKNFGDFDNDFTAPVFGFKSAKDYWHKNSCKPYLKFINKPSLLITALDDPFLSDDCYPFNEAKNHPYFNLLATKYGGHVGYNSRFNKFKNLWCENEIFKYIDKHKSELQ